MWLHLHEAEQFEHPVGEGFGDIAPFPEIDVPPQSLGDGDLVGFHEFDQGAVGILLLGKMAGRLAHVEGLSLRMHIRIHRKGESVCVALFF